MSLNNLAALLRKMSKGEQAEKLYMRSLSIREEALGPDHPQVNPSRLLDVRLLNQSINQSIYVSCNNPSMSFQHIA